MEDNKSSLFYGIAIVVILAVIGVALYLLLSDNTTSDSISLNRGSAAVFVGEQITLKVNNTDNSTVTWTSSDTTVATVTQNGIVTGVSKGEATITVSNGNQTSTCKITVIAKGIQRIELTKRDINLSVGGKTTIKVKVIPEDATNKKLIYKSNDETVATVDSNGVVTAKSDGVASITITDETGKAKVTCRIIVNTAVQGIKLNKTSLKMYVGNTETLVATITPSNATEKDYGWSTSDSSVVTVDKNGKITAKKIGKATIKVVTEDGNKEATCEVEVTKYNSFGAYKHVVILGIDGLGATFSKVSSPNFDRIFKNYAYRHNAQCEYVTISAQNWGSILTGVAYDVHGYTNSSIAANKHTSKGKHLSIFYYVHKKFPSATLASASSWSPINNGIIENDIGVKLYSNGSDENITSKAIEYINSSNVPTLLFIHFDEVDHNAHAHGGFSQQYYNAAVTADKRMGKIYDALKNKGLMKDTLFIVVADHGETTNGHGGHTVEESSVLLAVTGHSVNHVTFSTSVRNRDVAAIALYALGVDKPSHFTSKVPSELFGEKR